MLLVELTIVTLTENMREGRQNCPGIAITYKRAIRIVGTYNMAMRFMQ